MMYGSSGGDGSAPGGGVLYLKAEKMIIDGNIEANGASGKTDSSGGGSGGSILIESIYQEGSGTVHVNGGAGGTNGGGGGSGGRVAMYYKRSDYKGSITAFGGDSVVEAGAAGTIFLKDTTKNYSILTIVNKGRKPSKEEIESYESLSTDAARTWITSLSMESNPNRVELKNFNFDSAIYEGFMVDELMLGGGSHLAIEPEFHRGNLRLHRFGKVTGTFEGGSYGFLHTGPSQLVEVENTDYYIPINLKIYENGFLKLPPSVMLHKNSLSLNGYLLGVQVLKVSSCLVNFGNNGGSTTKGTVKSRSFYFNSMTLLDGGFLRLLDTSEEYLLSADNLVVQAGGTIESQNITFVAKDIDVQKEGTIKLDGQGSKCKPFNRYNAGSGGSHAGYGGLGPGYGGSNWWSRQRTEPFDSPYLAMFYGEAGLAEWKTPSCNGGSGGGKANISVSGVLNLDGSISSRYVLISKLVIDDKSIDVYAQVFQLAELFRFLIEITLY